MTSWFSNDTKVEKEDAIWNVFSSASSQLSVADNSTKAMIGKNVLLSSFRGIPMVGLTPNYAGGQNFTDGFGGSSDGGGQLADGGGEGLSTNGDGTGMMGPPEPCIYSGTSNEFLHIKIPFILGFGCFISCTSMINNTFLSYLFVTRPVFRHSHLFFLAILAFVDIFMAFSYIALMSTQVLFDWTQNLWLYNAWLTYFGPVLAISLSLMTLSTYLIVSATFERFLKTIPALANFHAIVERIRPVIVLLCLCFGLVLHGTKFWEVKIHEKENCTGFARYSLAASPPLYGTRIFHFYFRSISHVIIPFMMLMVMNITILWNLRRAVKSTHRYKANVNRSDSVFIRTKNSVRDATRMLIACVTMYLVSNSLSLVVTCWEFFDLQGIFNHYVFYTFANDTISLMPIVCGAIRLPIYCLCNTMVREACSSVLRALWSNLHCTGGLCAVRRSSSSTSLSRHSAQYQPSTMLIIEDNGKVTRNGVGVGGGSLRVVDDDDDPLITNNHTIDNNHIMTTMDNHFKTDYSITFSQYGMSNNNSVNEGGTEENVEQSHVISPTSCLIHPASGAEREGQRKKRRKSVNFRHQLPLSVSKNTNYHTKHHKQEMDDQSGTKQPYHQDTSSNDHQFDSISHPLKNNYNDLQRHYHVYLPTSSFSTATTTTNPSATTTTTTTTTLLSYGQNYVTFLDRGDKNDDGQQQQQQQQNDGDGQQQQQQQQQQQPTTMMMIMPKSTSIDGASALSLSSNNNNKFGTGGMTHDHPFPRHSYLFEELTNAVDV